MSAPRRALLTLHGVPETAAPCKVLSASLHAENTGTETWRSTASAGDHVGVVVRWNGEVVANHRLPRALVDPGDSVLVRFALQCPAESGPAELTVDLVRYFFSEFGDEGGELVRRTVMVSDEAAEEADRLWARSQRTDPWQYLPTQGISRLRDGTSMPVFMKRSEGCHVWDQHGRRYVDYSMGWGSILLGHAHPVVRDALAAHAHTGATLAWPQPVELDVADMIVADFPSAEMVCFAKNGSDVCSFAARLARLATGRMTILFSGYHGWQDFWTEQVGFDRTGVPPRDPTLIKRFPFHDLHSFEELYQEHKDDLAAIFVEPSPWAGNGLGFEPDTEPAFLRHLRESADRAGALLVFDEIVTGYRYPEFSVQAAKGVTADLTCLGKALASGLPLSALVGPAEIFKEFLPRAFYALTFHNESHSLAAARAAIGIYRTEPVAQHVWSYGAALRDGIHGLCEELGVPARLWGPEFRMNLRFEEEDPDRLLAQRTLFIQELLRAGVTTCNAVMLPCYTHDESSLEESLRAFGHALEAVALARAKDDWDDRLEIPPLIDP